MPIYEYECTKCGEIKEVMQKFSDKPIAKCSRCAGKLQKLISQSTFHLKGTGWYVTDYAGKSSSSSTPATNKAAKASTSNDKSKDTKSSDATEKVK